MYAVHKFAAYGKLSGKKLEDLRARFARGSGYRQARSARLRAVEIREARRAAWPSPWGDGRPGWHIECSAMSHEGARRALRHPRRRPRPRCFRTTRTRSRQTCGATHGKFAEIWMHNGFLNIDNEKMSKSLGNFFTTREVLAKIKHPEVLRFFLLSSHYRGPMNYSPDQLDQAEAALTRMYTGAARHAGVRRRTAHADRRNRRSSSRPMDDDFNTPEAIAVLQGLRAGSQY